MNSRSLHLGLAVLAYARPEQLQRCLDAVSEHWDASVRLYIDGPSREQPDSSQAVQACRELGEAYRQRIPGLQILAQAQNLGLRQHVEQSLDDMAERYDAFLVLEDDCVARPEFFQYCVELLERYQNHPDIGSVSGINFQGGRSYGPDSYHLSAVPWIWGWATWSPRWKQHRQQDELPSEEELEQLMERNQIPRELHQYWRKTRAELSRETSTLHSWGYPWVYSCWRHGWGSLCPQLDCVENAGHEGGTHSGHDDRHRVTEDSLHFPLRHPESLERDATALKRATLGWLHKSWLEGLYWRIPNPVSIAQAQQIKRGIQQLSAALQLLKDHSFRTRKAFSYVPSLGWSWFRICCSYASAPLLRQLLNPEKIRRRAGWHFRQNSTDLYSIANLPMEYALPQLQQALPSCEIILDAGANIGAFSLFTQKHVLPAEQIATRQWICIEPSEENCRVIREQAWSREPEIRLGALTAEGGPVTLLRSPQATTHQVEPASAGPDSLESWSLDEIIGDSPARWLLKLDIEGSEVEILRKPLPPQVQSLFFEWHLPGDPEGDGLQAGRLSCLHREENESMWLWQRNESEIL